MKGIYYLLLLFSTFSFAQDKGGGDKILYDEATYYIELTYEDSLFWARVGTDSIKVKAANLVAKKLFKLALQNYDKLVKEYSESELYIDALYQKGLMEFYIEEKDKAKETFKRVVKADREAYKKDSFLNLAAIAIDQKDFKLALEYLGESKKYSKMYMCGVEYVTDNLKFERMYDKCIVAISQKQ